MPGFQGDKFLALALASEADWLVSSDEDLLVLHPWRGLRIVTPRNFSPKASRIAHACAVRVHHHGTKGVERPYN